MTAIKAFTETKNYSDNYFTPPSAVAPLIPYLPQKAKIWEPCCGDYFISNCLEQHGFSVVSTDLKYGVDFLTCNPPDFDVIITNPPYSRKTECIERCYSLGKPFALLVPLYCLESAKRQALYIKHGAEVLIPNKRIRFVLPDRSVSSPPFLSVWLCWQLLPKEVVFCGI